ncbi:hypothetical protein ACFL5N_02080, partial [bacterium]
YEINKKFNEFFARRKHRNIGKTNVRRINRFHTLHEKPKAKIRIKNPSKTRNKKKMRDKFAEAAERRGFKFKVVSLKVSHATIEGDTLIVSRRLLRMLSNSTDTESNNLIQKILVHEIGEDNLIKEGRSIKEAHNIMMQRDPKLKKWEQNILPVMEEKHNQKKLKQRLLKYPKQIKEEIREGSIIKQIEFSDGD